MASFVADYFGFFRLKIGQNGERLRLLEHQNSKNGFLNIIIGNPARLWVAFLLFFTVAEVKIGFEKVVFEKIRFFLRFFGKRLDKSNFCAIIIKCVIIVFFFGGFLPFFQGGFVKFT